MNAGNNFKLYQLTEFISGTLGLANFPSKGTLGLGGSSEATI